MPGCPLDTWLFVGIESGLNNESGTDIRLAVLLMPGCPLDTWLFVSIKSGLNSGGGPPSHSFGGPRNDATPGVPTMTRPQVSRAQVSRR